MKIDCNFCNCRTVGRGFIVQGWERFHCSREDSFVVSCGELIHIIHTKNMEFTVHSNGHVRRRKLKEANILYFPVLPILVIIRS